jgi:hypothetical protein
VHAYLLSIERSLWKMFYICHRERVKHHSEVMLIFSDARGTLPSCLFEFLSLLSKGRIYYNECDLGFSLQSYVGLLHCNTVRSCR